MQVCYASVAESVVGRIRPGFEWCFEREIEPDVGTIIGTIKEHSEDAIHIHVAFCIVAVWLCTTIHCEDFRIDSSANGSP